MFVVDSHEDIAWNMQQFGRDYLQAAADTRARETGLPVIGQNGNTLLGWPDWVRGRVAVIFSTLFAAPQRHCAGSWESICYRTPAEAEHLYREQLDLYHRLADTHPEKLALITCGRDLKRVLQTWEEKTSNPTVGLVILMEGADAITHPQRLHEWYERGLRIVGPAWSGTMYAGGTKEPGPITGAGFELLDAMADRGMALDISHLSEEGCLQALDRYPHVVIASHGNPAALITNSPTPERHFSDLVISRLAERGGVLGVTAYNKFLRGDWVRADGRQEFTLDHVAEHIDYICQLTGSAEHAALGSDFDGGLGLEDTPSDLDTVADLQFIGDRLAGRGYSPVEVEAVLGGNWLQMLQSALPE